MLNFLIGIVCILLHRPKKLTLIIEMLLQGGLAYLEFGSSINPILTRVQGGGERSDYAHQITAWPPAFENLMISLNQECFKNIF